MLEPHRPPRQPELGILRHPGECLRRKCCKWDCGETGPGRCQDAGPWLSCPSVTSRYRLQNPKAGGDAWWWPASGTRAPPTRLE